MRIPMHRKILELEWSKHGGHEAVGSSEHYKKRIRRGIMTKAGRT